MYIERNLIGTSIDAREWIDKCNLSNEDKAFMGQFVNRFEDLIFYHDDNYLVKILEAEVDTNFPNAVWETRKVLAMVVPDGIVGVAFSNDLFSSEASADEEGYIWYTLDMIGFAGDEDIVETLLDLSIFPIADTRNTGESTLFVASWSSEIFEGNIEDILSENIDNKDIKNKVTAVFKSYAHLLSSITAIVHYKTDGKKEIY